MGKPLPIDVRVRDDSSPTPSSTDPSRRGIPTETPPPVIEGASDADTNLSPSTTTLGDPSAMSLSGRHAPGVVAWATDGTSCADTSGNVAVALGCDPSITFATTSTCVHRVMTGCVAPATVGATSAVGSLIRPADGSSIAAVTGCFATFKGAP